ncbi:YcxB family protein [Exiguobacterium sp. s102]|uniref:YcxB family protein n=1 Tax=Exiguobacterium sp. s102 TaxID=2751212 RepID=UPI001BE7D137|nr:YcxB family protein [Exiguobacterium sp. s102]
MIIKYQLTFEDLMSLQKDLIENTKYHKKRRKFLLIYTEILAFFYGFTSILYFLPRTIPFAIFCSIAVAVGILFAILLRPLLKKMYLPIAMRQGRYFLKKNSSWPRNVTLNLHEAGIDWNSDDGKLNRTLKLAWESIEKVNEDENHIYLYYQKSEALIIPKNIRVLSLTEQNEFKQLIRNHLNISL